MLPSKIASATRYNPYDGLYLDFNNPLRERLRDRVQPRVRRLEAPPRDHLRRRRRVAQPTRFDQGLPMLVDKVQVLRFPEGVHGRVEFAPPPQVHGGGPMLVAGDLDARQIRRFERGRVGATFNRRLDLALDGRDLGLSDGQGKMSFCEPVEINQCVGCDNSSLSHFAAMTRPCWPRRAARNRHRHAIEQAPRRWRGGRRDDSARTRRKI
jgi:hypothetical protein